MPRFFFDLETSGGMERDEQGVVIASAGDSLRGCIACIEDGLLASVDRVIVRAEGAKEVAKIWVSPLTTGALNGPKGI